MNRTIDSILMSLLAILCVLISLRHGIAEGITTAILVAVAFVITHEPEDTSNGPSAS